MIDWRTGEKTDGETTVLGGKSTPVSFCAQKSNMVCLKTEPSHLE
jgi:hypothetical protein